MKFEMRELRGDDLFALLGIVSKLDMQDDIVALFNESTKLMTKAEIDAIKKQHPSDLEAQKKALTEVMEERLTKRGYSTMAKLALKAMSNLSNIKDDLNGLFAELCSVKPKEIKELGLSDYTALVVSFFKKPELLDFFKSIASFMEQGTTAKTQ